MKQILKSLLNSLSCHTRTIEYEAYLNNIDEKLILKEINSLIESLHKKKYEMLTKMVEQNV